MWRLWTLGPIDRNFKPRPRRRIQYSLVDCLLVMVTLGGIGLLFRSIYDHSPLAFIAAFLILETATITLISRLFDAFNIFASAPAETAPQKSS